MTGQEFQHWVCYFKEKKRLGDEEAKKASKKRSSGPADREFKRTMGPQNS